jgi:hypothetical protein
MIQPAMAESDDEITWELDDPPNDDPDYKSHGIREDRFTWHDGDIVITKSGKPIPQEPPL